MDHVNGREVVTTMPDRREFMGLLAKVAMGATLTGADLAMLSTPAVATPPPARVGQTEVQVLTELTRVLWTQSRRLGGGAVRDAVVAQLSWAQGLFQAAHTDEVAGHLHAGLSDLLCLAGWASHDVNMQGAALRYLAQALAAAQEVDDQMRSALALNSIGNVYLRQGHIEDALQVFGLGAMAAERARSGDTGALVSTSQARAHATLGNEPRTREFLDRVPLLLANPREVSIPEPRVFDHRSLANETGRVHTVLAATNQKYCGPAIEVFTAYIADTSDRARAKQRAFALADLAFCHFRAGDASTGTRFGHEAVEWSADIRSSRLDESLTKLKGVAKRHQEHADAVDLVHRLDEPRG